METIETRTGRQIKKTWLFNGVIHRENDPAIIVTNKYGTVLSKEWYHNGARHRDDGPAMIVTKGDKRVEMWYQHGVLECADGPAITREKKDKYVEEWFHNGLRHRVNGPAVRVVQQYNSVEKYFMYGLRHRIGGPAVMKKYYNVITEEEWYENDKLHREDGPAVIYCGAAVLKQKWFLRGQLHREDGPAIDNETPHYTQKIWYRRSKLSTNTDGVYSWHEERRPEDVYPLTEFKEYLRHENVDYYIWYHNNGNNVDARVSTFDPAGGLPDKFLYMLTFYRGRVLVNYRHPEWNGEVKWPWLYDILPQPIAEEIEPELVVKLPTMCKWPGIQ